MLRHGDADDDNGDGDDHDDAYPSLQVFGAESVLARRLPKMPPVLSCPIRAAGEASMPPVLSSPSCSRRCFTKLIDDALRT